MQGLYREDERDGPGVLTSSVSSHDDVGFWSRERLIKLCTSLSDVFVVADRWPLALDFNEHRLRVTAVSDHGVGGRVRQCAPAAVEHLQDVRLPAGSLAVARAAFDKSFDSALENFSQTWRRELRVVCEGSYIYAALIWLLHASACTK